VRFKVGLAGLGIDLISLRRVQRFLKDHSLNTVRRLFSPLEIKKRGKISPLYFAKMFAAKEAFFKALGTSVMGIEGFRKIAVTLLEKDRFNVQMSLSPGRNTEAQGSFFRCGDFVGAQVLLWK
jgi:phosphopantetheine--protein transferase-like protein